MDGTRERFATDQAAPSLPSRRILNPAGSDWLQPSPPPNLGQAFRWRLWCRFFPCFFLWCFLAFFACFFACFL